MTTALLEAEGLSKRFGGLEAVSDVSVVVPEGKVLGISGPNGAGKTTLINLITGHLSPSSGRVVIDGRDLTRHKPWDVARAGVARTFQIVKPFRAMTVRENVAMGAMFRSGGTKSVREGLERSEAILSRVGLEGKGASRPGELSVADTKRLELAKALAMRPRLLFLDEVMAGMG